MSIILSPARILVLATVLIFAVPVAAHESGQHSAPVATRASEQNSVPIEPLPFALGGPFSLIDHNGRPRSREDFRGQFQILYFGYTECPYTCGIAAANIAVALDALADGGHEIGALFITIDPIYDTPERLAAFVPLIHPRFLGLTGDVAEIDRLQKSFQVHAVEAVDKGGFERLINHQPLAFLMGPGGDILTLFPPTLPPEQIARIVKRYL